MEMLQTPLLDPKTYCPWSNIYTVGLQVAASCAQAGFLDWASNLTQLRHLKAQKRPRAKRAPPPARRLPPKYVRRLFIWGFIGTNAAVSMTWARAADEAAATIWRPSAASLRAPGGLAYMHENFGLSAHDLCQGRWWTLLTYSISHFAPAHLIVNMCGFYTWASRCFDLGLGPGTVAGLMLGSAVCCGGASLASEVPGRRGKHMGASGIVSGLRESSVSSVMFPMVCVAAVLCAVCAEHALPVVARLVDFEAISQGSRRFYWSP